MYYTLDITTEYTTISVFSDFNSSSRVKFTKYPTIYNYELALQQINKKLSELVNEFGNPKALGISITGDIDYEKNTLKSSAYLYDYQNQNIIKDLHQILDCEMFIEQDCVCDALAELDNLGKNLNEFGLITVTYGIGGVMIRKREDGIYIHPTELGHTIVVPNGLNCPCGQRGCVEAYIGGENLKDRFLLRPKDIKDLRIWEEAVDYLAIATTNFLMCYPTSNIIYSGSSINAIPLLKNKIKDQLSKRMKVYKQPEIKVSTLNNKANSFGALKLIELNLNKANFYRIA